MDLKTAKTIITIINISSMGALKVFENGSAYVSSKAAMTGLTMCWQAEQRRHNIRVMQVNPSKVITDSPVKLKRDLRKC